MNSEKEQDEVTEPNICTGLFPHLCWLLTRDELFCVVISSLTLCGAGQWCWACCTTSMILHVKKVVTTKAFTSHHGKKSPGVSQRVHHPAASLRGCCPLSSCADWRGQPNGAIVGCEGSTHALWKRPRRVTCCALHVPPAYLKHYLQCALRFTFLCLLWRGLLGPETRDSHLTNYKLSCSCTGWWK